MPQPVRWWWTGGGRSKQVPIGLAKVQVRNNNYINYINKFTQVTTNSVTYSAYVTCHAKTRPSAHFIILRKTIMNTEHERFDRSQVFYIS